MSAIPEIVALLDRLQAENRQLAESAAMWQERAAHLTERLALRAPGSPVAADLTPEPPTPAVDTPSPLRARLYVLSPWLVAGLMTALVVWLAWHQ
jgi:hypothetical protein